MTEPIQPELSRAERPSPLTPVASRRTPLPLAGRERTGWRLSALLLILRACRGRSATVEQLHILMWYLRDEANANAMLAIWNRPDSAQRSFRAFDPSLDEVLSLARASGWVAQQPSGRQALSAAGATLADTLRSAGLMEAEQQFLVQLGGISESRMWQRLGAPGSQRLAGRLS
jgi:hypothetical protein